MVFEIELLLIEDGHFRRIVWCISGAQTVFFVFIQPGVLTV